MIQNISLAKATMFFGPMLSYFGVELTTGNTVWGVVASGFFTMCGIIFMNRHRVIAANAVAEMNRNSADDIRMANLCDRMTVLHKHEIDFWKDAVQKKEKAEVLIRATKHRLISAYHGATWVIKDLEEQLRAVGVEVEPYRPQAFHEITGAEDKAMIETLFEK